MQKQCCLSCRGVNWNALLCCFFQQLRAASHVEAWIEIISPPIPKVWRSAASHVEAWIEIDLINGTVQDAEAASHVEAWIEIEHYGLKVWLCHGCLSCRGVNWNRCYITQYPGLICAASHVEAWIEIFLFWEGMQAPSAASHVEAWIEISSAILTPYLSQLPLM